MQDLAVREEKKSRLPYALMVLPFLGFIFKNILLQCYFNGTHPYSIDAPAPFGALCAAILLNSAVAAVIFAPVWLFRRRGKYIYCASLALFFTVLALIDVYFYRSFNSLPSVRMAKLLGNAHNYSGSLTPNIVWSDVLFFADLLICAVIAAVCCKKGCFRSAHVSRSKTAAAISSGIGALIIAVLPLFHLAGLCDSAYEKIYNSASEKDEALYFTNFGFHVSEIARSLFGSDIEKLDEEQTAQINAFYEWKNSDRQTPSEYEGVFAGKNIFFIQVESLESFVIGQKYEGREITPHLNEIAGNSLYFPNIVEQVKCGNSSDCDFMMNTSVLPPSAVSVFRAYPDRMFTTFPNVLKKHGYSSYYYNSSSDSMWRYQDVVNSTLGYEKSYFDFFHDEEINGFLDDSSLLSQTYSQLKKLDLSGGNKFIHIVTTSSHTPFSLPNTLSVFTDGGDERLIDSPLLGYMNTIHHTDQAIGRFIDLLRNDGMLDNAIVVIYGDHCGIHKYFPNDLDLFAEDPAFVWVSSEINTIPFMIWDPNGSVSEKFDVCGGQVDLMPTVAYAVGIYGDISKNAMGRCLFTTSRSFALSSDGTLVGDVGEDEYLVVSHMFDTADLIIRSNYFKNLK